MDQMAHEKMVNTTDYSRNAMKYHLASVWMAIIKKKYLQMINTGEGVEKGNPPTLLVGMWFGAAAL